MFKSNGDGKTKIDPVGFFNLLIQVAAMMIGVIVFYFLSISDIKESITDLDKQTFLHEYRIGKVEECAETNSEEIQLLKTHSNEKP